MSKIVIFRNYYGGIVQINKYMFFTYILSRLGTAAVPYLVIKAYSELEIDIGLNFPKEKTIVFGDFYVNDVLTGV